MKPRNSRNAALLLATALLLVMAGSVMEPVAAAAPPASEATVRTSTPKADVSRRAARQSLVVPFFSFVPRS